jgi:GTP-binding protein
VVRKPTGDGTVFADIPGLIAGAHEGVGLGSDFLRHIQRTRVLLHLIDITDIDPIANYHTIQHELEAYGEGLKDRPQIVALNKVDAVDLDSEAIQQLIAEFRQMISDSVFVISAVAQIGLNELTQQVWQTLELKQEEIKDF